MNEHRRALESARSRRLRTQIHDGAGPRRVALATATLITVLAVLVGLTLVRGRLAEQVRSRLSDKLGDADRVAYYVVSPDAGPSFWIGPQDRSLELITHLLLPASLAYDPAADYAYAVIVSVRDPSGGPVWRHEINIRSRQSKAGGDRFGWRHENAFLLADDRQLTDDRLTRVQLPAAAGDRLVELRLIPKLEPPGATPASGGAAASSRVLGLARVYVRRPRSVDERALRALAITPEQGRALVEDLTYRGWEQLSDDERQVKLGHVWERLAAIGEPGRDYETLSIYETGFRSPRVTTGDAKPLEVDRWRSLAVNVLGPATLELRTLDVEPLADSVEVSRRGLDGGVVRYPSSGQRTRTLRVPGGVHTLVLESPRRVAVELAIVHEVGDTPIDHLWLVEADRSLPANADGEPLLEPDTRRIDVVRIGPRWPEAPRWAVPQLDEPAARMFRFDIRVAAQLPGSWWPDRGPTPSLDVCFFASDGEPLGCDAWTGQPSVGSPFEGLELPDLRPGPSEPSGLPGPAPSGPSPAWYVVSEPQTIRVIAPIAAASLELRAPQSPASPTSVLPTLIVRGYGYWPGLRTRVAPPFAQHESERSRWRYAPLATRTWFPIRPSNYDALDETTAHAQLLAQVRLEPATVGNPDRDDDRGPLAGADGWDPGPWRTLDPRGVHRRRLLLERLDPVASRRLRRRWDPSLVTQILPGHAYLTDLSATGPGAPELHWRVDPSLVGQRVRVKLDDRVHHWTLTATRGRWRLPVSTGRRTLEVVLEEQEDLPQDLPQDPEPAASTRSWGMWLDRPIPPASPTPSPPCSRRRVLHQLTRSLVFPVHKPGPDPLTVNVVVYLPRRRDDATIELSFDGGAPRRRTGVVGSRVSVANRRFAITREAASQIEPTVHDQPDQPALPARIADLRTPTHVVDLDTRAGTALDVVTLQLTLGRDVLPGAHELRVTLLDGGRVWVRAFHRGVGGREQSTLSWTESVTAEEP